MMASQKAKSDDQAATSRNGASEPKASSMSQGCAWIDGDFVPIEDAKISILETGFVRSDVTYDVVGVWKGKFFRLDDHLDRFELSYRNLRIAPPLERDEMREILVECVSRSGIRDAYVEMLLTRGIPEPGQRDPRTFKPRFYAYAIPYVWIVRPEIQEGEGTHLVVARDVRRTPPGAMDPTIKNFQWGDFMRGLFEAYERGGWLALLTDGDGNVAEGPGFNIFAVTDGALRTPATGVLQGVTRKTVLDIAEEHNIPVEVGPVPTSVIYNADELFITSTAGGVMPIPTLDGEQVGNGGGKPGPLTTKIRDIYWAWHDDPRFVTEVDYAN